MPTDPIRALSDAHDAPILRERPMNRPERRYFLSYKYASRASVPSASGRKPSSFNGTVTAPLSAPQSASSP